MIIIEFTKQTIKALDRKLKIVLKFNNPQLLKKVASLCIPLYLLILKILNLNICSFVFQSYQGHQEYQGYQCSDNKN